MWKEDSTEVSRKQGMDGEAKAEGLERRNESGGHWEGGGDKSRLWLDLGVDRVGGCSSDLLGSYYPYCSSPFTKPLPFISLSSSKSISKETSIKAKQIIEMKKKLAADKIYEVHPWAFFS